MDTVSEGGDAALPLRVSTLELFFDLVFVFAITQLTSILTRDVSVAAGVRVLLIFGVLWWMYGGDGVAVGVGYLIVVVVHGWLYLRVNRNIARITAVNVAAALLVIGAGLAG